MNTKRLEVKQEKEQLHKIYLPTAYIEQNTGDFKVKFNNEVIVFNKDTKICLVSHRDSVQVFGTDAKYTSAIKGLDENYETLCKKPKAVLGKTVVALVSHKFETEDREITLFVQIHLFGIKGDYLYNLLAKTHLDLITDANGELTSNFTYAKIGLNNHKCNMRVTKKGYKVYASGLYKQATYFEEKGHCDMFADILTALSDPDFSYAVNRFCENNE